MDWARLLSSERIRITSKYKSDIRNEFESDFGRIIFSPALRRMHDKTQVFPLTADDNIHSRLTHSNEVMSIGYTFGLKLTQDKLIQQKTEKNEAELLRVLPVILKNICLIHDIGNAPFGHFGETVISEYFQNLKNDEFEGLSERQKRDFIKYDGNAQGLRVLTKLQYLNDIYGLNLTYATLASYLKYPNFEEINKNIIEKSKHGVFFSEEEFFNQIMHGCDLWSDSGKRFLRHPLCYLMEAADSIAYYIMDIEDGFNTNLLSINDISEAFQSRLKEVLDESKSNPSLGLSDEKIEESILKKVIKICSNDDLTDKRKIVNIRIYLMTYLVDLAYSNFSYNLDTIEIGEYNRELIKDDIFGTAKILSDLCANKIFTSREINSLETTGYSVFSGLLDYYIKFLFHEDKKFRRRAKNLISRSIIACAIEENLENIYLNKTNRLKKEIIKTEDEKEKNRIENYLTSLNSMNVKMMEFKKLEEAYMTTKIDYERFNELKKEIYETLEPDFDDLDNYYKFRVILDFISGMTDKFALNHFNNISGQSIN